MDLLLWRHAEALDTSESGADLDRPLSAKGERQALRVARWLNQQMPAGARVLVSPALRCQQTAAQLDRKFKTVAALAPDTTVDALLHASRWPDAREPVLLIGHQPTLGLTAAYLLSGQPQHWQLRKAGVWWLRGRLRDGELQVVLHAAVSPELV